MENMDNIIRKIEALLNTKGCTEAEAEARTAKAQELLERYNLDMATIGGKDANARKDQKRKGGLYSWQRNLWKAVAELNFCYYVSLKGLARGSQYEHRLIGSHVNVVATEHMAQYLQETVERLAQAWAKENYFKSVFVREAIAFREGMTARLSERLQQRRHDTIVEARRQKAERDAARADASPGTTELTIVDVISSEADFNNDYLNGWDMGTTARHRHEADLRYKEWRAKEDADLAARDAAEEANPALREARLAAEAKELADWNKSYEKRQARRNKTPPRARKQTAEEARADMGSYREGRVAGEKVGLDTQVKQTNTAHIR